MAHIYINLSLVSAGILIMAVSLYMSIEVCRIFSSGKSWFSFGKKLKNLWKIIPVFVMIFLAGYIAYLSAYLKASKIDYTLLTSLILFIGSLFVFIIGYANLMTFRKFNDEGAK